MDFAYGLESRISTDIGDFPESPKIGLTDAVQNEPVMGSSKSFSFTNDRTTLDKCHAYSGKPGKTPQTVQNVDMTPSLCILAGEEEISKSIDTNPSKLNNNVKFS